MLFGKKDPLKNAILGKKIPLKNAIWEKGPFKKCYLGKKSL